MYAGQSFMMYYDVSSHSGTEADTNTQHRLWMTGSCYQSPVTQRVTASKGHCFKNYSKNSTKTILIV